MKTLSVLIFLLLAVSFLSAQETAPPAVMFLNADSVRLTTTWTPYFVGNGTYTKFIAILPDTSANMIFDVALNHDTSRTHYWTLHTTDPVFQIYRAMMVESLYVRCKTATIPIRILSGMRP
ncbi:MAG TPA: hypothetical protein VKI62_09175 [Bacteroidota bacterium]|nr:hypothetical protein [Bacteroidota bacterium]